MNTTAELLLLFKQVSLQRYKSLRLILACLFTGVCLAVPANGRAATNIDVTDIYTTPSTLIALQDTTVTATLENSGDSGYFNLSMYIDGFSVGSWQMSRKGYKGQVSTGCCPNNLLKNAFLYPNP